MSIVNTTVGNESQLAQLPRLRPRKIAPAPKRKVEESEQNVIPSKKAKKEAVVKKEIKARKVTAVKKAPVIKKEATVIKVPSVKKESVVKKEAKVKKEPAAKKVPRVKKEPTVKKVVKASKVKKEPKAKKAKIVHKLPPEASIYLNDGMRGRVLRAMKQRMYVLSRELSSRDDTTENFEVLGSIGNSYTVSIGNPIKCTCMDHAIRRTHCKHILMVLLKVYRLGFDNPMFQKLTTTREERIRARSSGRVVDPSVLVPTIIRERILKLSHGEQEQVESHPQIERRSLDTSDCPICFEEFEQAKIDSIDYCKVCGNNIHQECFNMWKSSKGRDVSCVYCRSKWVFPRSNEPAKKSVYSLDSKHRYEGVANFALELGLDRKRDTSTYKTYRGYPLAFEGEGEDDNADDN